MTTAKLLAGASGYSFKEWKGVFYPEDIKSDLERLTEPVTLLPTRRGAWKLMKFAS